jgi:hypothetical protein
MRIESSVTAISWIPSRMISGLPALPFSRGVAHYDQPPPDRLEGPAIADRIEQLRAGDRFRIANHLAGWVDVDGDEIIGWGQHGGGVHGTTRVRLGVSWTVGAVGFADLRPEPEVGDGWVRFRQSAGGRTGVPAPRHIDHPPFVQIAAPPAWTTLELTVHADGRSESALVGASPFPRHWIYDSRGALVTKSGVVDFDKWYRQTGTTRSPWGDDDMSVLIAAAESPIERRLGDDVMGGLVAPSIRVIKEGDLLMRQGEPGRHVALLLDGVAMVVVDGEELVELGPGAVIGERAWLESGPRTATVAAVTDCTVATVDVDRLDLSALVELRTQHRREHDRGVLGPRR